jgi:serine protease DegQ
LEQSAQSTASAQLMSPALQGATLSDGQTKTGDKGVKVDTIEKGTPAEQVGLQKDDVIIGVNRNRVQTIAEMRKILEGKPPVLALNVVRGDESIYLLLR